MKTSDRVTIPPQVMGRQVGEETVILDLPSGTYFGLDPFGARMWQLMGEGRTLGEVCEAMLEEYDVSRDALEHDILELAQKLLAQKLVSLG